MKNKYTLWRDQYGNTFTSRTIKELRGKIAGRCSLMYQDKKDGSGTVITGRVIGQHWLTAFQPVEVPA